jgi:hypothetical protein
MKQWLIEFKQSWQDKTFVCAIISFILAYVIIALIGLFLPIKIFIVIITAIAGWQLATWSWELGPKIKQWFNKS